MSKTVVLLGDSIIDNAPYIAAGELDVAGQLRELLPDWQVDKRALDGSICADVIDQQLADPIPEGALIVLSTGGNDALGEIDLLLSPAPVTNAEAMIELRRLREKFRDEYVPVMDRLVGYDRPILVLTIYNPRFELEDAPEGLQEAAEGALSAFNDVIQQEALRHGADILDTRILCADASDFANPIEPSAKGGQKIAKGISAWLSSISPQ